MSSLSLTIEPDLLAACPHLAVATITAQVTITASPPELIGLLEAEERRVCQTYQLEDLAQIPALAGLRSTYKALGKKPQKYRGSSEALLRRVVKGQGLYQLNNIVEINNLLSMRSGRSVGSYNLDTLQVPLSFGIGQDDEPYQGIGRGSLNIAKLPVFRDQAGAFGSPTSDSERSKITPETQNLLMVIIGFDGDSGLAVQAEMAVALLSQFAGGTHLNWFVQH